MTHKPTVIYHIISLQNSRRVLFMCIIFENTLKMILGLLIYLKLVVPDIRLKFTFSNRNQLCQTYLTLLQRDWSWLSREKSCMTKYHKYLLIHRNKKTL